LARADADGSGELDRGEFCALLAQLGVACSEEQNALFEAADEDCSSAVSITEFRSWWLAHEAS
jgi:Ca2+-binding EF-hand superfamily protein